MAALSGRVAALESILLVLCDRLGADGVRARTVELAGLDTMVQVCFSPANPDPSEGLASYVSALTLEVHPLLLWQPGSSQ